jgi:hypothetical protein
MQSAWRMNLEPKEKMILTGNPVRQDLIDIESKE